MNFSVSSRYDCMFTIQSDYSIDTNNLTKHRDVAVGCISTENRIVSRSNTFIVQKSI